MSRVTAIYATPTAIPPVSEALQDIPEVEVLTLLDEALLRGPLDDGGVLPRSLNRMATHLRLAEQAGSQAALVTCNMYSGALPALRRQVCEIRILGVDEPMIDQATRRFCRLAVIGTVATGLETQLECLRSAADAANRELKLMPILCDEAFTALSAGDTARHDELIAETVSGLSGSDVEAVVLAQASMARALPMLVLDDRPVLSSPQLAAAALQRLLAGSAVGCAKPHSVTGS